MQSEQAENAQHRLKDLSTRYPGNPNVAHGRAEIEGLIQRKREDHQNLVQTHKQYVELLLRDGRSAEATMLPKP